jgi:hypothetical protein
MLVSCLLRNTGLQQQVFAGGERDEVESRGVTKRIICLFHDKQDKDPKAKRQVVSVGSLGIHGWSSSPRPESKTANLAAFLQLPTGSCHLP